MLVVHSIDEEHPWNLHIIREFDHLFGPNFNTFDTAQNGYCEIRYAHGTFCISTEIGVTWCIEDVDLPFTPFAVQE